MTPERKRSSLTVNHVATLLRTLNDFRQALDEDDEVLPSGFVSALDELCTKLEDVKDVSVSKIDASVLLQANIKSGLLFLAPEKKALAEEWGSTEIEGKALSMDILKELIKLVRHHVSLVTEAGCRVLINLILLRVASAMSTDQIDVDIMLEYPITKTLLPGNYSFEGVVDFLLAKLPGKYTKYLLQGPTFALLSPHSIKGLVTSNIFEAKRDEVHATLPRAIMTTASYCQQQSIPVLRGCVTSGEQWVFFIYSMTDDGGTVVSYSNQYNVGTQFEGLPLILGLLHDWVDNATDHQQSFFSYDSEPESDRTSCVGQK